MIKNKTYTRTITSYIYEVYRRMIRDGRYYNQRLGEIESASKYDRVVLREAKQHYKEPALRVRLVKVKKTSYTVNTDDIMKYIIDNGTKTEDIMEVEEW